MFYKNFADDYEKIFPFREITFQFLKSFLTSPEAKIIDIGCATGHYCGRFSKEGYSVSGIDLDAEMIRTARKNYRSSDFSVLNLTDIDSIDGTFDMVYSTGNVLAHVDETCLKLFLSSIKQKMNSTGTWIFQVINWDYILKLKEFDFPVIETETKEFIRKYTDISEKELTFHTELINKKDRDSVFKDSVKMYPLPSDKYINIHKSEGFKLVGHFADFSKKTFNSGNFSADIYVFSL